MLDNKWEFNYQHLIKKLRRTDMLWRVTWQVRGYDPLRANHGLPDLVFLLARVCTVRQV